MILDHYPNPVFYTYLYLVEKSGELDYCLADVPEDHLNDLEISGFIKLKEDKIYIKENGKFLHEPPKPKFKKKKEPFKNPRLDKIADIVGYPTDWHKREKYESLFRKLSHNTDWESIQKAANWFKDNKRSEDLVLNYFLSKDGFRGIKYQMENPRKEKEEQILFRGELTKDQDEDECLW